MANSKKYSYQIEQVDNLWTAQILRKASSKSTVVSKKKEDFATEAEAQQWAEQSLLDFTATLSTSNKRHGAQRKSNEEERLQRSNRRAEKTKLAKQQAEDSSNETDL